MKKKRSCYYAWNFNMKIFKKFCSTSTYRNIFNAILDLAEVSMLWCAWRYINSYFSDSNDYNLRRLHLFQSSWCLRFFWGNCQQLVRLHTSCCTYLTHLFTQKYYIIIFIFYIYYTRGKNVKNHQREWCCLATFWIYKYKTQRSHQK